VLVPALVVSIVLSAVMAYIDGQFFVADRDSMLRTKRGGLLLVAGTLSFIPLPPQVVAIGNMKIPDWAIVPGVTDAFLAPKGFNGNIFLAVWLLTSVTAALAGVRIWDAGKPGWRPGMSAAFDTSPVGRARGLLVMADSLDEAADIIARVRLDAKSVPAIGPELETFGTRLAPKIPAEAPEVYRALVAGGVPIPVAGPVARHIHDGAQQMR
jgi:hypothetical protein